MRVLSSTDLRIPILSDSFYQDPSPKLSQGDIIVTPHLYVNERAESEQDGSIEISAKSRAAPALILNFDCEIDKPWSERFIVCPIVPLDELPVNQRTNAKKNRIAHLFFLPRNKSILADSVTILNQQTTIARKLINPSERLATLSAQGRLALYAQFVRWLSRWELTDMTCPHCGVDFDPTLTLPVRHPDEP